MKCTDAKKMYMMQNFVGYLLEHSQQSRLSDIGLFPVTVCDQIEYTNAYMSKAWEEIKKAEFCAETYLFNGGFSENLWKEELKKLQKQA